MLVGSHVAAINCHYSERPEHMVIKLNPQPIGVYLFRGDVMCVYGQLNLFTLILQQTVGDAVVEVHY